jgi:ankyrin repeat protein
MMPATATSVALKNTDEKQQHQMLLERDFLTRLAKAAVAGETLALQTTIDDYIRDHPTMSRLNVLREFKDGNKRTVLHFACQSPNHTNIASEILSWVDDSNETEALISAQDEFGFTPLMLAVQQPVDDNDSNNNDEQLQLQQPHQSAAQALLDAASDRTKLCSQRSNVNATALHYAAGAANNTKESIHVMRQLLDAYPEALYISTRAGGTPLHWAVAAPITIDKTLAIQLLLNAGADWNSRSETVAPALCIALGIGHATHAMVLLQEARLRNIDMQPTLEYVLPESFGAATAFHLAADSNMSDALGILMEMNQSPELLERKTTQGLTPLQVAAQNGHVECVLLLLPKGSTEADAQHYIQEFQQSHAVVESETLIQPLESSLESQENDPISALEARAAHDALEILANASTISELDKVKAVAFKAQGNLHFQQKDYNEAVQLYTLAITANPRDATFHSNRSACYVCKQQPMDALYDAIVARTLQPNWPKAWYRVAVARLELFSYEQAALAAYEGLQLNDNEQLNDELQRLLQKSIKLGRKAHQETTKKEKEPSFNTV